MNDQDRRAVDKEGSQAILLCGIFIKKIPRGPGKPGTTMINDMKPDGLVTAHVPAHLRCLTRN